MFRSEPHVTVKITVRKRALIIKTQLELLTKRASIPLIGLASIIKVRFEFARWLNCREINFFLEPSHTLRKVVKM